MKNTKTLLIPALLILLSTACEGEKEEFNACRCTPLLKSTSHSDAPILNFYETYKSKEMGQFFNSILMDSIHFQLDSILYEENDYPSNHEFAEIFRINIDDDYRFVESPELGFALTQDTSRINEMLSFYLEENWFEVDKVKFAWSKNKKSFLDDGGTYNTLYALKLDAGDKARFSSEGIQSAIKYKDSRDNEISINVSMNEEGTQKWSLMTIENVGNYIAIVSRGKVLSAPIINGPITGGETRISGDFTENESQELVDLINCEAHKREIGQAAFLKEVADCSKKK